MCLIRIPEFQELRLHIGEQAETSLVNFRAVVAGCCVVKMVKEKGMMGDMFGNMSFDSSSEDDEEEAVPHTENEPVATNVDNLHADPEVGYRPLHGPAILVRQIRELGLSFQLWPAATGMCRYLENASIRLRGARVVELGAGTGMAGVMAARFGAQVTLTDLPHVLPNLQSNVDLNLAAVEACGGSLAVRPLRWGVQEDVTTLGCSSPDIVLASDCVYYDTLFEPLMQTLKWLCVENGSETVVLLAHLRRWKKDAQFFRNAAKCFHVEVVHKHPLAENARTGVLVYKFARKPSLHHFQEQTSVSAFEATKQSVRIAIEEIEDQLAVSNMPLPQVCLT